MVECYGCKIWYHQVCAGPSFDGKKKKHWLCERCQSLALKQEQSMTKFRRDEGPLVTMNRSPKSTCSWHVTEDNNEKKESISSYSQDILLNKTNNYSSNSQSAAGSSFDQEEIKSSQAKPYFLRENPPKKRFSTNRITDCPPPKKLALTAEKKDTESRASGFFLLVWKKFVIVANLIFLYRRVLSGEFLSCSKNV